MTLEPPEPAPPMGLARWRLVGPGIVVAATGVGAGDLVATLIAGARFGYLCQSSSDRAQPEAVKDARSIDLFSIRK